MSNVITKSDNETKELAKNFIEDFIKEDNGNVVLLHGNLGAGKTTFVKGIMDYFGISSDKVKSPTFIIMKKYDIDEGENKFNQLYHLDAYRVNSYEDIKTLEIEKILLDKNKLFLIEWPDNISDFDFGKKIDINFEYGDSENERVISTDFPYNNK